MPEAEHTILQMRNIGKRFGGVRALDGVDFDVRAGEAHALVGENGAGKSTLMNILAGRFNDYTGDVRIDGSEVRLTHPRQARQLGIAVIHQDLSLLPNLTVAENIMLGEEQAGRWTRHLNRRLLREEAAKAIERLGFDLDPDARVADLGTARQYLVEITSAIRRNARLIVFDEPTASLGQEDVERLFSVVWDLKGRGIGMVYISHRLAELECIADRVTVLRDGRLVETRDFEGCRVSDLTRLMLGHALAEVFPKRDARPPGKPALRIRNLTKPGVFEDVSFDLHEGEVLGLAGLVGSGRTDIARAIFGAENARGTVEVAGRSAGRRKPSRLKSLGVGMLPENRKLDGAVTGRTVGENATLCVLKAISGPLAWLSPAACRRRAMQALERTAVEPRRPDMEIQHLSGGNQQKVIVSRWLEAGPGVLIFDEPTQGIDVGTKAQIYRLIRDLAAEGRAVLLISSELIEIAELADRVLVVRNGRVVNEMPAGKGLTEDSLFDACAGKERNAS